MASPLYIAQQIFSQALQKSTFKPKNDPSSYQCINGTPVLVTTNTSSNSSFFSSNEAATAATAVPQDFSSLVNFFFSSSALTEWFKIFIYGSLLAMFRKLIYYIFGKVYNSFFITATFEEDDISYSWICFWLSRQPTWRKAREVEVSTEAFGFDSSMIEGEIEDTIYNGARQLAYLPAELRVHSMWYKNHWMRVTRFTTDGRLGSKIRHIQLCVLTRSHTVLNDILMASKKEYEEAKMSLVGVYSPDHNNSWRVIAARPKRSLDSIVLDPGIKDILIEDAKSFLASRPWYSARGIPFRRGYLLYGPPGSGKTSLIHSVAGELGLDMYPISLSKSGMDDSTLNELISRLPEKCITLMEDIDAAFSQTVNRESPQNNNNNDQNSISDTDSEDDYINNNNNNDQKEKNSSQPPISHHHHSTSRVTLSGLLNALDGVGAQEGRILFATTNKYGTLDPALCRPGRMDIHMEFKNASRYQARELFKCFYTPDLSQGEDQTRVVEDVIDDYPSESDGEKGKQESGSSDETKADDRRRSKRVLSMGQVEKLAEEFANAIPERELSMASLQGYLMGHKVTPVAAVKKAAMWVTMQRGEGQRGKKERRKDEKPGNNGVPVEA